jgi:hypothetical protein
MAIGEDVGLYNDRLSDDALDGESAAIDLRSNALDNDSTSSVVLLVWYAHCSAGHRMPAA